MEAVSLGICLLLGRSSLQDSVGAADFKARRRNTLFKRSLTNIWPAGELGCGSGDRYILMGALTHLQTKTSSGVLSRLAGEIPAHRRSGHVARNAHLKHRAVGGGQIAITDSSLQQGLSITVTLQAGDRLDVLNRLFPGHHVVFREGQTQTNQGLVVLVIAKASGVRAGRQNLHLVTGCQSIQCFKRREQLRLRHGRHILGTGGSTQEVHEADRRGIDVLLGCKVHHIVGRQGGLTVIAGLVGQQTVDLGLWSASISQVLNRELLDATLAFGLADVVDCLEIRRGQFFSIEEAHRVHQRIASLFLGDLRRGRW